MKIWKRLTRKRAGTKKRTHDLQDEILELKRQLDSIDSCFDQVKDDDMIDSIIYQRSGLMARYEYLIKQAKEQGLTSDRIRISV